jgi:hypothetical protein
MKREMTRASAFAISAILVLASLSRAQDDRSIKSDDFAKGRPASSKTASVPTRYKPKAKAQFIARREKPARPTVTSSRPDDPPQMVGLTLWRLRELRDGESTANAVRVMNSDKSRGWRIPVRTSLTRPISVNDLVRLTVETHREGYLYVIDSEIRRDGTLGDPVLLFPESPAVDNLVQPGGPVELPDRTEKLPYFRISSKDPNYAGELLTVVISPKKIASWDTGPGNQVRSLAFLSGIEESVPEGEYFELEENEGEAETPAEIGASSGNLTRTLKDGPANSRRLTRDQPLPQSVCQTRARPDGLIVVPIRLTAARK